MRNKCTMFCQGKTSKRLFFEFNALKRVAIMISFMLLSALAYSQPTVPFSFTNSSTFSDANVYVAIVGMVGGNHVWIDAKNSSVRTMSTADNTVQGPIYGGDGGPGLNGKYANCFARLSEIPNKTVNIPGIAGCRILISFNSQLYLYFFGATGGYAAPNLVNTNDPNQGIRFEMIELTNASNGLWANTTRVDSYQYPMGLEVWGNSNFYQKVGEIKTHDQIIAQWKAQAPAEFQPCLNAAQGIIKFPSKNPQFQAGGASANYFASYIDQIWSKYTGGDLVFSSGDAGVWRGRVSGSAFTFTRASDGQVATISRKPTTQEAMEGSGALASGAQWDLVVQAQICAAINRHAIDLNLATGATQDFATPSKYYVTAPYNWYCKFWHGTDITLNSKTYSFCYDDVFNQSSTINAPVPTKAVISIGGYPGSVSDPVPPGTGTGTGVATFYKDCNYTGTAIALPVGDYTMSQLVAKGISNDDLSSVKVNAGYKVTLYWDDNFSGTTKELTSDLACDVTWNDKTSSLKIATNGAAFSTLVQAESYTSMLGVQLETTTDAGGGQNVGWIDGGDWMAYNVTIPTAGTYSVIYRVASPNAGKTLRLEKDNGATLLGTVNIPNTGGWQTWANVSHIVTLPAGTYSIGLATATGGFNINYFTITSNLSARSASQEVIVSDVESYVASPNPVVNILTIKGAKGGLLGIINTQGVQLSKGFMETDEKDVSHLPTGVYHAVLIKNNRRIVKTFIKN